MSPYKLIIAGLLVLSVCLPARAADLTAQRVTEAIEAGKEFLLSKQETDGRWSEGAEQHVIGFTSMALLALINCGMTASDPPVQKGLNYLRKLEEPEPRKTYEAALMIMALAAANDNSRDTARVGLIAARMANSQNLAGDGLGSWGYDVVGPGGGGNDRSNAQFAILGLREASEMGVPINRAIWERALRHWQATQSADGGWGYSGGPAAGSSGSMTVAGVSSLTIMQQMLQSDADVSPEGVPPCCRDFPSDKSLDRALKWLGSHFRVSHNPGGAGGGTWLLYYMYGVERAGRLSGRRFFGDHDWYREGAETLIKAQNQRDGSWKGVGPYEETKVLGTSLSLLFLSKGLAPVLINKLKHGPRDQGRPLEVANENWNRHHRDVRNLTEYISSQPKWPHLLTTNEVDIGKAVQSGGVESLLQAPILYITHHESLQFTPAELALLKDYLQQGGFIFAVAGCQNGEFERSLKEVLKQILPPGEGELKPLAADHPVYRSEFLLDPDSVPLLGVDFGCRTSVIYSPEDLGCYWDYWARHDPPGRNPKLKARIIRATNIGVNVCAYATGREPPKSLEAQQLAQRNDQDRIERGLLQVAKIRHTGGWDAAPRAVKNLLSALNEAVGLSASTKVRELPLSDNNVYQYPLIYMHGRYRFQLNQQERENLKQYLERGGVLMADACCGAQPFDRGFRDVMQQVFPDKKLERIPIEHEIFSEKIGQNVRKVKRRGHEVNDPKAPLQTGVREVEPFLEGIQIDGRYVVIYSKYDISCALERQSSVNCEGYLPDDALKLATNIVLYAMFQDLALPEAGKK